MPHYSVNNGEIMKKMLVLIILFFFIFASCRKKNPQELIKKGESIKILHIMSFHSPWIWTDNQLRGFKDAISGINAEFKIIQMDAKKRTPEEQKKTGVEILELIKDWKPELIYSTDDAVQKYVISKIVNEDVPCVFSGVNKNPEIYNYVGSKNVIGVLEHEHIIPSIKLLQKIIPVRKIAVLSDDDDENWVDVYKRIREKTEKELPEISITQFLKFKTFNEYKNKIIEFNNNRSVDAFLIVGWFTFKNEAGMNVDQSEVAKWHALNSNIPEISFWEDRVIKGNLCSVTVDSYEQGLAAGEIAKRILLENVHPASFEFKPTVRGKPVINLARAKKLGIIIPGDILGAVSVIEKFEWDK